MKSFRITTLVENTASASLGLLAEHGVAFLVEVENRKILFDTGQGMALVNNAATLGIDLAQVDSVVLSHGHIDHAGGLVQLLSNNSAFTLYAHPQVFANKQVGFNGQFTSVGIADDRGVIEESGITIKLSDQPQEIATGVQTSGRIPMNNGFEEIEPMFYVGEEGRESPDFIEDDQALILETAVGTVVILGCAHRGIINTLNHVVALTGRQKIHAVMGGMHLLHADEEKLKAIVEQLEKFDIEKFIVGHCTGFEATHCLRNAFGEKLVLNEVGIVNEF